MKVPNIKEILKPRWAHKPGFGMNREYELSKQAIWEQGTTPNDSRLLGKLGILKGEKVLAIAGYYASWASQVALNGARVDYSDISKEMVNYSKKLWGKLFRKYICSNYELIPVKRKEYDWTFTYEACGGTAGLPLAYLRSLLNNKGGILVLYVNRKNPKKMGSKPKTYPRIVRALGDIYNINYEIKKVVMKGHRKGTGEKKLAFMVCTIRTNKVAREKAYFDLKVLDLLNKKNKIYLSKEAKKFRVSEEELGKSIKRLSDLSKVINREFVKQVGVR